VALLLVAGLIVAPIAETLMGHDEPPPLQSVRSSPPAAEASTDVPSPAPPACAGDSLIGTLVAKRTTARTAPDPSARVVHTFSRISVLGSRQVFLLLREVRGRDGATWFRALLPIRPNGTAGFIPREDLEVRATPYRLELERRRFELKLFDGCRLVKTFRVGTGTGRTPTPVGRFYLTSLIKLPDPETIYGPYAYGLSGYSDVLDTWKLGGIIGLHGTDDPSSIGRRSSHGCIRMRNRDIKELVKILPLGTPIEIH
jgi:L,D-transpeptidase catalytic domain